MFQNKILPSNDKLVRKIESTFFTDDETYHLDGISRITKNNLNKSHMYCTETNKIITNIVIRLVGIFF